MNYATLTVAMILSLSTPHQAYSHEFLCKCICRMAASFVCPIEVDSQKTVDHIRRFEAYHKEYPNRDHGIASACEQPIACDGITWTGPAHFSARHQTQPGYGIIAGRVVASGGSNAIGGEYRIEVTQDRDMIGKLLRDFYPAGRN